MVRRKGPLSERRDEDADIPGRVAKLAVTSMPGSGMAEELRERAGISAAAIVDAVRKQLPD